MEFGGFRIEIIPDTEFWLDGGAMFGVVPRVLWERVCPPDELNRIKQQMNCVFIDTGNEKVLIETGIGEKWTEKETKIYGIRRERPFARTLFEKTGCRPEDITIVINTHLHFDHAGGNTILEHSPPYEGGVDAVSADGVVLPRSAAPQFPNARYLVSKRELDHAESPHERDRASYLPENWRPMQETGQLETMPDEYEPVPGLKLQTIRGHSETMQTWRLDRDGKTLYGFADLIPTHHHLPLPWIMGYDLYPTETLAFKKETLPQAVKENWMCLFYHDFESPICRLIENNGKIKAVELDG
ncbi:MAG TPA: MBL fold metallo-hydrolase [Pyrinomonadaceae bacterium]|nr:MBL fold metallo-hydrolase [Pyrinomonadaceae bacterium]HMP67025.1 MBL fold metallo-hydrolase [Pyrinomonadaceae bacterium]